MNTKVKVGIAAAIVAALVALIMIDHKSAPSKDGPGKGPAPDTTTAAGKAPEPSEFETILQRARQPFAPETTPAPAAERTPIKLSEPPQTREIPAARPPAVAEEYVILQGDSYEGIAQKVWGDRRGWESIARANPTMRPEALRVGKKIAIPARPERADPAAPAPVDAAPALTVAPDGKQVYTVQSGDTLSGISKKVYNTARHSDRIFDANRDKLSDPHDLRVGMKLALPDLPKAAPAGGGVAPTSGPAPDLTGKKVHLVQAGEVLWNIADKYRGERGIMDMIKAIVQANPERLKDESTLLRVGWQLAIPE